MKIHIVTISFDKDLEWLKYCIRSIQKYCRDYSGHTIILDDHENDCDLTKQYLDSIDYDYVVDTDAKHIPVGYVRQQYMKIVCDKYLPDDTDYVCHVDSDSVFYEYNTPEMFFSHGNNVPDMLITNYDDLSDEIWVGRWKQCTEQFMKQSIEFEYMRRMPLVYSPSLMKDFRQFTETVHSCDILSYLQRQSIFTEYNVLGAFASKFHNDQYNWINTHHHDFSNLPLLQVWSNQDIGNKSWLFENLITNPQYHLKLKSILKRLQLSNNLQDDNLVPHRIDYRTDQFLKLYRKIAVTNQE